MVETLLTFGKFPQLLGCEDAGGGDNVVANDAVVGVVRVACREREREPSIK